MAFCPTAGVSRAHTAEIETVYKDGNKMGRHCIGMDDDVWAKLMEHRATVGASSATDALRSLVGLPYSRRETRGRPAKYAFRHLEVGQSALLPMGSRAVRAVHDHVRKHGWRVNMSNVRLDADGNPVFIVIRTA